MDTHAADVLKLKVGGSDEWGYRVDLSYRPCGERGQALALPFDAAARRAILRLLEPGAGRAEPLSSDVRAALEPLGLIQENRVLGGEALLQRIGQMLFEALFPVGNNANDDLRGALQSALCSGLPLPCQLQFDAKSAGLAGLPWELLCDDSGPLVAGGRLHFTRYIAFGRPITRLPIVDSLSVLVVSPRPPMAEVLPRDREERLIHGALATLERRGLIRVDPLSPPTLEELEQAINRRPYHVLHFDGHGGAVRRCPHCDQLQRAQQERCTACGAAYGGAEPQGCLVFESAAGAPEGRLVTGSELATVLAHSAIRLCVISACSSTTLLGTNVFNSVGPKLIETGVPAVVGMQFRAPEQQAAAFVDEFYTRLAADQSIAAAADAGRRRLRVEGPWWYIPTTYLRTEDGEGYLFRFKDTRPPNRRSTFTVDAHGTGVYLLPPGARKHNWTKDLPPADGPYRPLRPFHTCDKALFFGRSAETNKLVAAVVHTGRRCAVLLGAAGVGKTSLVNAGLIPQLVQEGYLVLSVREYGDPPDMLRQAAAGCGEIDAEFPPALDLPGLVDLLLADVGRPLLLVFDEFEHFLADSPPAAVQSFVEQVARCVEARYTLPVSFLFVLREDLQSRLSVLQERVPSIFADPVLIKAPAPNQAEQAITRPLGVRGLPVTYDVEFLHRTLLSDLATGSANAAPAGETADETVNEAEPRINPTYLQIVCAELLEAALPAGTELPPNTSRRIDAGLYAPRRAATILNSYLDRKLAEHFPDTATLLAARTVLQQMVTADGERRFISAEELVRRTQMPAAQIEQILAPLQADGLLEVRTLPARPPAYSAGHHFLAEQIRAWFDPQAALRLSAQDVLNRSLDRWRAQCRAQWRLQGGVHGGGQPTQATGALPDIGEALIGPHALADIRAAQQPPPGDSGALEISAVQYCLLLRSAVHLRRDMEYWTRALHKDGAAQGLLKQIQAGGNAALTPEEDVRLGAGALGLRIDDGQPQALARAAVAHADGEVRHTAALALAALGEDALAEALPALQAAQPRRRSHRPLQVLAQVRACNFPLPEAVGRRRTAATWWAAAIKAADNRLQIFMESACAGLGAGFGLGLAYAALAVLLPNIYSPQFAAVLAVFLQPLGILAGCLAVIAGWLAAMAGRSDSKTRRALGICAGFVAGVTGCWLPFDLADRWITAELGGIDIPHILAQHVLGSMLWGCGIALGYLLAHRRMPPRWPIAWCAVMSGIGGAAGCLLAIVFSISIPFVDLQLYPLDPFIAAAVFGFTADLQLYSPEPYIAAAVFGFTVGAGLAGGWACGRQIYCRFQSGGAPTPAAGPPVPQGGGT